MSTCVNSARRGESLPGCPQRISKKRREIYSRGSGVPAEVCARGPAGLILPCRDLHHKVFLGPRLLKHILLNFATQLQRHLCLFEHCCFCVSPPCPARVFCRGLPVPVALRDPVVNSRYGTATGLGCGGFLFGGRRRLRRRPLPFEDAAVFIRCLVTKARQGHVIVVRARI